MIEAPITHSKPDDYGQSVVIHMPTKASTSESWFDPDKTAVFIPGGKAPTILNGTSLSPWIDHPSTSKEWNCLDELLPSLDEPPLPNSALRFASGVVAIEDDGRVWMVSPSNQFGGYKTTFPKGKLDDKSISLQANAIKETFEESGLKVLLTGYLGDFKRTTSMTRLYLAERVGGDPTDMGWESQAVRLVPPAEWAKHLTSPTDQPVLEALKKHFAITR
jgi:ADP-ribose pyrophosphatase YjhB (NUDIX family)